jgi:hypothetical protein
MDEKTIEELKTALIAESESTSTQAEVIPEAMEVVPEVTEDPLKIELEKFKSKKTPQEKAKDSLFFNAQKAKELGIDVAEVLGIKQKEEEIIDEGEKPLTRKDLLEALSAIKTSTVVKSAEELASEIADETERELTLFHINNTLKSTGDPKEDLRLARALTNSVRNSQILEEVNRKPQAKTHSSASGASTGTVEPNIVLTAEEQTYLATGLVTKDEILLARQGKPIKA